MKNPTIVFILTILFSCNQAEKNQTLREKIEPQFIKKLQDASDYQFESLQIVDTSYLSESLDWWMERENETLSTLKASQDSSFDFQIQQKEKLIDSLIQAKNDIDPNAINHMLLEHSYYLSDSLLTDYIWVDSTYQIIDISPKNESLMRLLNLK